MRVAVAERDYVSAHAVASEYGLNADEIYLAQWHASPVDSDTIAQYLDKVRSWRRTPFTLSSSTRERLSIPSRAPLFFPCVNTIPGACVFHVSTPSRALVPFPCVNAIPVACVLSVFMFSVSVCSRLQVQDRALVLQSCLDRIPNSSTAARILLEYGQSLTNAPSAYVHCLCAHSMQGAQNT